MSIVNQLKAWLKNPKNTKSQIAAFFGYNTSDTINKWISRGRVPRHAEHRLNQFLKGEIK